MRDTHRVDPCSYLGAATFGLLSFFLFSLLGLLGCGSNPEAPPPLERAAGSAVESVPAFGVMYDEYSTSSELFNAAGVDHLGYARVIAPIDVTKAYDQPITDFDWMLLSTASVSVHLLPILHGTANVGSPDELARWQRFAYQLAMRYGPIGTDVDGNVRGTFWTDHPEVSYLPIHAWEIWNEPNHPDFGNLTPKTYRAVLREARTGLRRADESARIVFGGLAYLGSVLDYFEEVVSNPDAKCLFDAVAIHPYANTVDGVLANVKRMVDKLEEMKLVGKGVDDDVQIWLTEIGWAVAGPTWQYCAKKGADGKCDEPNSNTVANQEAQRESIGELGRAIVKHRSAWHLGPTIWFAINDVPKADGEEDAWWRHAGMLYTPAWFKAGEIAAPPKDATVKLPHVRCPNQ